MATKKRSSKAKAPARKKSSAGRKAVTRKSVPKKKTSTRKKSSTRKYSPTASKKVGRAMHEMKRGKLRSGRSKKKVTNPKQAIAIGLSEARARGAKVPKRRKSR